MEKQDQWEIEIGNLLDIFHDSAAKSRFEQYFDCFTENGCFIGTDGTEYWRRNEFQEFCLPHFQNTSSAWIYLPIQGKRSLYPLNSTGSHPIIVSFDELLRSNSLNSDLRGSGTIVWNEEKTKWEILSYYLSFPIPDSVGSRVARLIGDHLESAPAPKQKVDMKKLEAEANAAAAALLAELDLESKSSKKSGKKSKKKAKGKR
jgi:hypothetical protein